MVVSTMKFSKIQALPSHQLTVEMKHTWVEQERTEGEKRQQTWNTYSHNRELGTFPNSSYKKVQGKASHKSDRLPFSKPKANPFTLASFRSSCPMSPNHRNPAAITCLLSIWVHGLPELSLISLFLRIKNRRVFVCR